MVGAVVVVVEADELLLVADEERRLAVTEPFGGLGQGEADAAQPLDGIDVRALSGAVSMGSKVRVCWPVRTVAGGLRGLHCPDRFLLRTIMRKRIAFVLAVAAAALAWVVIAPASTSAAPPSLSCTSTHTDRVDLGDHGAGGRIVRVRRLDGGRFGDRQQNASSVRVESTIYGGVTATPGVRRISSNGAGVGGAITLNKPGAQLFSGGNNLCTTRGPTSYAATLCPVLFVGGSITVQNGPRDVREVSIGECGYMDIAGERDDREQQAVRRVVDGADIDGSLFCINDWPPAVAIYVSVGGTQIGCASQMQ